MPLHRKLPPQAKFIRNRIEAWIHAWSHQPDDEGRNGEDKCQHLVYSCLLGRFEKDPFRERLGQLVWEVRNYLEERQCPVPKAADRGREKIDLALLFALGMLCEDPDFESMKGSSFEADTV